MKTIQSSRVRRASHRTQVVVRRPAKHWRAAAVAMSLGCVAVGAQASDFGIETGVGITHFNPLGDGIWYQEGFSHQLKLNSPSFKLGVTGDLFESSGWQPGLAWHLDYYYMGRTDVSGDAAPDQSGPYTQSGYYSPKTQTCVGNCGAVRYFHSDGNMNGIALTLQPFYDFGKVRVGVELGPFLYRSTYHATATALNGELWPAGSVQQFDHNPRIDLGAVAGVSVSYYGFGIAADYFYTKTSKFNAINVPPVERSAFQVMATYTYRF